MSQQVGQNDDPSATGGDLDLTAPVRCRDDVWAYVARVCFKTGPPGRVGIEAEWIVQDAEDGRRDVDLARLVAAVESARGPAGVLPRGSTVTFEPGGQLELSTACASDVSAAIASLQVDAAHVRRAAEAAGLRLVATGVDPERAAPRVVHHPRYDAMERFFDTGGSLAGAGRAMMRETASLQVCLDVGADRADAALRWRRLHALAPMLAAAFANSPVHRGRRTGWRSTRQQIWSAIDPSRTGRPIGADPVDAWTDYVLAARVMLVRRAGDWVAAPGFTFADWVAGATSCAAPTFDDLAYHVSTLFPPVRPRGWYELRCIDALPDEAWPVAAAVVAALVDDERAGGLAEEAMRGYSGGLSRAGRAGLTDTFLAAAARTCFAVAVEALPRVGAGELAPLVESYVDRYVMRGRCPADDVLDRVDARAKEALCR